MGGAGDQTTEPAISGRPALHLDTLLFIWIPLDFTKYSQVPLGSTVSTTLILVYYVLYCAFSKNCELE